MKIKFNQSFASKIIPQDMEADITWYFLYNMFKKGSKLDIFGNINIINLVRKNTYSKIDNIYRNVGNFFRVILMEKYENKI